MLILNHRHPVIYSKKIMYFSENRLFDLVVFSLLVGLKSEKNYVVENKIKQCEFLALCWEI